MRFNRPRNAHKGAFGTAAPPAGFKGLKPADGKDRSQGAAKFAKDMSDSKLSLISRYCGRAFTEQDKNDYICAVYNTQALKPTKYYRELHNALERIDNIPPAEFSAERAKKSFRDILSVSVIDDNAYNSMLRDGTLGEITAGLSSDNSKERVAARQQLLDHTVSINPEYFKIKPDMRCPIPGAKTGRIPIAYRISAKYDFDKTGCQGLGLMDEEVDGANML